MPLMLLIFNVADSSPQRSCESKMKISNSNLANGLEVAIDRQRVSVIIKIIT